MIGSTQGNPPLLRRADRLLHCTSYLGLPKGSTRKPRSHKMWGLANTVAAHSIRLCPWTLLTEWSLLSAGNIFLKEGTELFGIFKINARFQRVKVCLESLSVINFAHWIKKQFYAKIMKQIVSVPAYFMSWRWRYNLHKRRGTRTLETNDEQYFPLDLQVIQGQIT
jgi:hypothetical protein